MRILVLSAMFPPHSQGGYELACLNVCRELAARGHSLFVLTSHSHVRGDADQPYVHRRLGMTWWDPYDMPPAAWNGAAQLAFFQAACSDYANSAALVQALREFDADLAYCWMPLGIGGLALMDVLNIVGIPCVLLLMDMVPDYLTSFTPPHVRHFFNAGGSHLYAQCGVISMAQHILDMVAASVDVHFHQPVTFIPGWVDTAGLARRTAYRLEGQTRFVAAGTVSPLKGTHLIAEAAALLVARGVGGFSVDVFGEGAVADNVERARRLGVEGLVRFLGGRTQRALLDSYHGYDAFLFPTRPQEAFGFAPIEAAAAGCVPIMTAQCGAAERMVDEVHCLKIERSAEALAAAMERVIRGEVDLARMGAAGAALVASDLSERVCMDQIEQVLEAHRRPWSRARLDDPLLLQLIYTKHHLARSIVLGIDA